MKRIWEFISLASQSRTTALLVILVIGASIPLTVLVAQKQQEIRQQAAVDYISSLDNTQLTQTFTDPIDGKTYQVTEQQKAAIEAFYAISPSGTGKVESKEYDRMRQAYSSGPVGDCIANCGGVTVAQTPAGGTTASACNTPGTASCNAQGQICVCGSDFKLTCGACSSGLVCADSGGSAGCKTAGQGLNTTVDLKASPDGTINNLQNGPITVAAGTKVYFSWSSVNSPDKCTASGGWTGDKASAGQEFVTVNNTGTYTISCIKTTGGATTNSPPDTVIVNVPAAAPAVVPTATSSSAQTPNACAQFSQYCNSAGQCNWGTLPGTSACAQVVTSYYQTCLKASGNLTPQVESICSPSAAGSTTSAAGSTTLNITVGLNGVGKTGDRKAPGVRTPLASEKSPRSSIQASVFISDGKTVVSGGTISNVILTYDAALGKYKGTAAIPASVTGTHDIRIKVPGHLIRKIGTTTGATQTLSGDLIAGDINADNSLSILDYNMLIACWLKGASDSGCQGRSEDADLNVDGIADQLDYNLWLREFALIEGD